MKFVPRNDQIIGRMVIKRSESKIIRTDESKVTKFVLADAVGPGAEAKGIKVGDIVIVTALKGLVLDAGMFYVPMISEADVALFVTDVTRDDLLVQSPDGKRFVEFDTPEAAQSFAAPPQKPSNGEAQYSAEA